MMNHAVKGINFNTFIDNIRNVEDESVDCATCRGMGFECNKIECCPTLSELAEYLTGEVVENKTIKVTQLEYDVLQVLRLNHGDEPIKSCPVICDLLENHFKRVPSTSLTITEIFKRAEVED